METVVECVQEVCRYLAVKYPLQTRVWCSTSRAKLVVSVIATVSFVYKLPSLFELTLDEDGRLAPTPLRTNGLYIVLYNTYGYLLLLIIIPWTTMIVLNVIVIRSVQQAYRIRRSLMSRTANADDRERHCTIMAFVMILTFIACNFMAGINHIIEAFFPDCSQFFRLRLSIGNLLVCVNRFVIFPFSITASHLIKMNFFLVNSNEMVNLPFWWNNWKYSNEMFAILHPSAQLISLLFLLKKNKISKIS